MSDASGLPSRRAHLVALLVTAIGAVVLITLLVQVSFLNQPILGTPFFCFADLLAIVLGASYLVTYRLVTSRRSNGRAS